MHQEEYLRRIDEDFFKGMNATQPSDYFNPEEDQASKTLIK